MAAVRMRSNFPLICVWFAVYGQIWVCIDGKLSPDDLVRMHVAVLRANVGDALRSLRFSTLSVLARPEIVMHVKVYLVTLTSSWI